MSIRMFIPITLALISTGAIAQVEFGYGLGMVKVASKDRPLHVMQVGYLNKDYHIGVDALYQIVPTGGFTTKADHQYVRGGKLLAKTKLKFASMFYGLAKAGVGFHKIGSENIPKDYHNNEVFFAYAAGIGFDPNKNFSVALNIHHDKRKDVKFKDSTYPAMNFNYLLG